jgi:hypothetical protein
VLSSEELYSMSRAARNSSALRILEEDSKVTTSTDFNPLHNVTNYGIIFSGASLGGARTPELD